VTVQQATSDQETPQLNVLNATLTVRPALELVSINVSHATIQMLNTLRRTALHPANASTVSVLLTLTQSNVRKLPAINHVKIAQHQELINVPNVMLKPFSMKVNA